MTQAAVIKKLSEDKTKKQAVIDVLKCLNGESYSEASEILELAKHFLSLNAMLDYELAKDIINEIDIAGED